MKVVWYAMPSLFLLGTLGTLIWKIYLVLLGVVSIPLRYIRHALWMWGFHDLDSVSIPLRYIRHILPLRKKKTAKKVSIPLRYIRHCQIHS